MKTIQSFSSSVAHVMLVDCGACSGQQKRPRPTKIYRAFGDVKLVDAETTDNSGGLECITSVYKRAMKAAETPFPKPVICGRTQLPS
jgi:hypothetical protein